MVAGGRVHRAGAPAAVSAPPRLDVDPLDPQAPRWLADGIVFAFLGCLGALGAIQVALGGTTTVNVSWGLCYLGVLLAVQIGYVSRPGVRYRPGWTAAALLAQAIAVYVPHVQFGQWWVGLPGLLAGSLLLTLPTVAAIPAFAAVVASIGWLVAQSGWQPVDVVFHTATTAFTGLTAYGLTRLARVVRGLQAAQGELARLAVAEQRLQFASDLQALLGARLSAIMSRCERIVPLLSSRRGDTSQQVEDLLRITRDALAEVRSVASGYQNLSLAGELSAARTALESAEVRLRIEHDAGGLPGAVSTVLAEVLQEAVTNVLRHSDARWSEIAVHMTPHGVRMDVVNDGADEGGGAGRGMTSMSRRVASVNGELHSGIEPGGIFRLRVSVPLNRPEIPGDIGAGRARPDGYADALPRITHRLANGVLAAVLGGFGVIAVADVVAAYPGPVSAVTSIVYLVALLALQIGYFGRRTVRLRSKATVAALLVQAALVYLPMLQFRELWQDMPGFLAGTLLVFLRFTVAIPLFSVIVASIALLRIALGHDGLIALNSALSAAITGLVVYGLTRLARSAGELHATRNELAQMAVAEERLRFARDVHDLLGLSLSAIALKAELANRLLQANTAQARVQLIEIIALARNALGDVRSVAAGYQQLSLAEELSSAQAVLSSADIHVRIDRQDPAVSKPVGVVLATVVREGVTNVLRHSKAEWCEVTLHQVGGRVQLEIRNDGVHPERSAEDKRIGGHGIDNLGHRVVAVGGEFTAGPDTATTYRLRASVPVLNRATASPTPSRFG